MVVASGVEQTSGRYGSQYFEDWVRYEYSVNGVSHQGSNLRFPNINFHSSPNTAYGFVKRYRPGSPVDVFYDPEDPELSVLKPGIPARWRSDLETMLLANCLGAGLLILTRYMRKADYRTVEESESIRPLA